MSSRDLIISESSHREKKLPGAAPDLRGSLEALERAAQSSREVTIRRYALCHVDRRASGVDLLRAW